MARQYFLFGYMNRNWEEEIDVPVGPDNNLQPGRPDLGQPTHFQPRRNRFMFRVPVPKNFTDNDEMIWTLTTKGKTEKAFATTRIDYKIDDVVVASETGALGAGTSSPEMRANKRPVVKVEGERKLTAKVGQPVALTAIVTDDGVPRRRGGQGGGPGGAGREGGPGRQGGPEGRGAGPPERRSGESHGSYRHRTESQSRVQPAGAHHGRQGERPAPLVVRVSRRLQGDVRSTASEDLGRYPGRRELAVGAALAAACATGR